MSSRIWQALTILVGGLSFAIANLANAWGQALSPAQSPFAIACKKVSTGAITNNVALDSLISAAEQVVGPIQTEDRCEIYDRALQKLTRLQISGTALSDLALLSSLKGLESLTLSNNQITDLSPLSSLENLTFLDITANRVSDLSPVGRMRNLARLNASGNQIKDLSPIQGLSQLSSLHVENNLIQDVGPLSAIPADLVSLAHNQISDISALSRMPKVIRIYAHSNKIRDISAFTPPSTLMIINLSDNPVDDSQIAALSSRMGITDQNGNKRVVFSNDLYNKDIDFVPTTPTIKVSVQ